MKFTVLIAEDDENDAMLLMRVVKKIQSNVIVHLVADGEQAIQYLKAEGKYADRQRYEFPRVLITDLKMPRKSGFELLEWLEANPECRVVPAIVFSASKEPADVIKCYQLGANAYFQKPTTTNQLATLVQLNFDYWVSAEVPPLESKKCS